MHRMLATMCTLNVATDVIRGKLDKFHVVVVVVVNTVQKEVLGLGDFGRLHTTYASAVLVNRIWMCVRSCSW